MVTPRIDDTGDRATRSMNAQPVRKLLRVSSDGAKVLHDGADTIALLDAKLGGAGYLQLDTSSRRDTREQWQLVDHCWNFRLRDADASERCGANMQRSDFFATCNRTLDSLHICAHPHHRVEKTGARRVQADVSEGHLPLARERTNRDKESRRRRIRRDVEL